MTEFLNNFTASDILMSQKVSLNMPFSSFEGLLLAKRKEMSREEYIDLFYYHSSIEKCITNWKSRDINTGMVLFKKVAQMNREAFPQSVREGAETVFLAATAYYDYVVKQYDPAFSKLQQAIEHIKRQKELFHSYVFNLYEQNLNMLRVYFKTANTERVKEKAVELLKSILFNINQSDVLDESLSVCTDSDKNTWFYYIMDNFIIGVSGAFSQQPDVKNDIYSAVFGELTREDEVNPSPMKDMMNGVRMLYYAHNGNMEQFGREINTHFESLRVCPSLHKKLVLAVYLDWAQREQAPLEQHPNYSNFEAVVHEYTLENRLHSATEAAA